MRQREGQWIRYRFNIAARRWGQKLSWSAIRQIAEEASPFWMCLRNLTTLGTDRRADSWKWQHVQSIYVGGGTLLSSMYCMCQQYKEWAAQSCLFLAYLCFTFIKEIPLAYCLSVCALHIWVFSEFCSFWKMLFCWCWKLITLVMDYNIKATFFYALQFVKINYNYIYSWAIRWMNLNFEWLLSLS